MDDLDNLRRKPALYTVQIGYRDWKKMAEALAKVKKMGYLPTKNENGGDNIFKPSGKNGLWIAKIVKIEDSPETWKEYKKRKGIRYLPETDKKKEKEYNEKMLTSYLVNNTPSF